MDESSHASSPTHPAKAQRVVFLPQERFPAEANPTNDTSVSEVPVDAMPLGLAGLALPCQWNGFQSPTGARSVGATAGFTLGVQGPPRSRARCRTQRQRRASNTSLHEKCSLKNTPEDATNTAAPSGWDAEVAASVAAIFGDGDDWQSELERDVRVRVVVLNMSGEVVYDSRVNGSLTVKDFKLQLTNFVEKKVSTEMKLLHDGIEVADTERMNRVGGMLTLLVVPLRRSVLWRHSEATIEELTGRYHRSDRGPGCEEVRSVRAGS